MTEPTNLFPFLVAEIDNANSPIFGLIIMAGFFLAVIGAIILFLVLHEKEEGKSWRSLAKQIALEYRGNDRNFANKYGQKFDLFSTGFRRRAKHVIEGSIGDNKIVIADYRFRHGDDTYQQTVCLLFDGQLNMPCCRVRPQDSILDALGKLVGGQDIDIPDDPEFSRAFVVQGVDEQAVREVLAPSVRLALMQVLPSLPRACAERNQFSVEADGEALLVNAGRSLAPKEVPKLVTQSLAILNALVEVRCLAEEHTA